MAWIDYITDPSEVEPEVMQALQALATVITSISAASGISFSYDAFFSGSVTTVAAALIEIANSLAIAGRQLVTVEDRGDVLVDGTRVFQFLCHKSGVLGLGMIGLSTAPSITTTTLQIMKNNSSVYEFTFAPGEYGPKELDLSFITVVKGDLLGLNCVTASGAGGLMAILEY